MLTYGRYNIQTIAVIAVDLSDVGATFENPAARNVEIVGCDCAFDNFAVSRVQFVGYHRLIRQFATIR